MSGARKAIIIGITGQDGFHLTKYLLQRGYEVVGVTRNVDDATRTLQSSQVALEEWDMHTQSTLDAIFTRHQPMEAYNFAAHARGSGMYTDPVGIGLVNGIAVTRILESIRQHSVATRFCQASSAEMFGEATSTPQDESTEFNPRSPYGAAKLYAHTMLGLYRRNYGLHVSSAILYNHESPRRSEHFVTRRVTQHAAKIKLGLADELRLGNLESQRDWGYAGDYVHAMHLMLEQTRADDYVIATGLTHSVRELCEIAFQHIDLDYRDFVKSDAEAYRPSETVQLVGNPEKIKNRLHWKPAHSFREIVTMMVDADLQLLSKSSV